jgi:glucokinase
VSGSVLAFDVGGTTTRAAIVRACDVQNRFEADTVQGEGLADSLVSIAQRLLESDAEQDGVQPIGISVPGPLSADRRNIAFTGNLGLRDYPLADLMERRLQRSVVIDDDANCAALGEATFGAARGTSSSVTLVVGTGVGAGIVLDGVVHRGAHALAGELGHVLVEREGLLCSCGGRGCLEAMTNGAALTSRAGGTYESAKAVLDAAERGNSGALSAVRTTAGYLAIGVAAVASLLDPECIVLAGGVGRQPLIVEQTAPLAKRLCVEPIGSLLDLRAAQLGDDSGLLGAAVIALAETPS